MPHSVKVIIPVYTTRLNRFEALTLQNNYQKLQNHPIVLIAPEGLDLSNLLNLYPRCQVETFSPDYFNSISSYNRLMMSEEFYRRFSDVDYILICQTDAYIFRDELAEWCEKGYDYVGAPWLVRPIYKFPLFVFTSWLKRTYCSWFNRPNSQITNFKVGNGGLSLRKVSSHLRATTSMNAIIREYLQHPGNHIFNEDVFFSVEVNRHGMGFRYPDYMEALQFSFDKYPALCYRLNHEQLPFGCHSWYKRKMKKFWFPIILRESRS